MVTFAIPQLKPRKLFLDEMEKGSLPEYLYASASFPLLFKTAKIETQKFTDGGLSDNLPATILQGVQGNEDLKGTHINWKINGLRFQYRFIEKIAVGVNCNKNRKYAFHFNSIIIYNLQHFTPERGNFVQPSRKKCEGLVENLLPLVSAQMSSVLLEIFGGIVKNHYRKG